MLSMIFSNVFFLIWGYLNPRRVIKKNCELMMYSRGGITLQDIEQMMPFDRDEYWEVYHEMEKERIESIAEAHKRGVSADYLNALYR